MVSRSALSSSDELPWTKGMTGQRLEFDRSLLGVEFDAGSFDVTQGEVLAFSRAVGETAPLFTDEAEARRQGCRGLVAPPTFPNLLLRRVQRPDPRLSYTGPHLHAGQVVEVGTPICAGDRLTARGRLADVYVKTGRTGAMAFTVWETRFVNQSGETAALLRESFAFRQQGGAVHPHVRGPDGGPEAAPVSDQKPAAAFWAPTIPVRRWFDELQPGDEIGPWETVVLRRQVVQFVRLWGEVDDRSRFTSNVGARRAGLRRAMAPGILLMALLSKLLTDWSAGLTVRVLDVIFRQPVLHDCRVRLHGMVTDTRAEDGRGLVEADVYLDTGEGGHHVTGRAVVALPFRPS
jgi:acyl dehydratase